MIPKYRAWDKHNEVMYKVNALRLRNTYDSPSMLVDIGGRAEKSLHLSSVELMQCTGLKDKNGVEIFDGDIIKMPDDRLALIGFDGLRFYIEYYDVDYVGSFSDLFEPIEVVGNIYESEELFK